MQTERAMQSEPSWRALNEIPPSPYVIIRKKLSCEIEEFPHFSRCLPPSPHRFKISSNLFSASRVFYVLWLRRTEAAAAERTSRAKARKFMHETKIHAKSFRFLYANYSKALQAGTLKRGLGRRLGRGKSFGIYASRDSTNKEVGIKTLESQNAFKHSLLRSETGKIFRAKTCDKLVSKHQCRTVFLESHASSSSDCTSEKGTEEEKKKKIMKKHKKINYLCQQNSHSKAYEMHKSRCQSTFSHPTSLWRRGLLRQLWENPQHAMKIKLDSTPPWPKEVCPD